MLREKKKGGEGGEKCEGQRTGGRVQQRMTVMWCSCTALSADVWCEDAERVSHPVDGLGAALVLRLASLSGLAPHLNQAVSVVTQIQDQVDPPHRGGAAGLLAALGPDDLHHLVPVLQLLLLSLPACFGWQM